MSESIEKQYNVIRPIAFGGRVEAGSVVAMSDEQAERFLAGGDIELVGTAADESSEEAPAEDATTEGGAPTGDATDTAPEAGSEVPQTEVSDAPATGTDATPEGDPEAASAPAEDATTEGGAPGEEAV